MILMDIIRFIGKNYKVNQDAEKSWFGAEKGRFLISIIISFFLDVLLGLWTYHTWDSLDVFEKTTYIYGIVILGIFILLLISERNEGKKWALVINFIAWIIVLPFVVLRAVINRNSLEQKIGVKDTIIFEIVLFIDLLAALLISTHIFSWSFGITKFLSVNFQDIMSGHTGEAVFCLIFIGIFKITLDLLCVLVYAVLGGIDLIMNKKEKSLSKLARLFEIYTSRGQLLILIFVFMYCTFNGDKLNGQESNIINILTIYTLIILLSDKNKEWAPEIEELLG